MIRPLSTLGWFAMLSAGCAADRESPSWDLPQDPLQIQTCQGQRRDGYILGELSVAGNVLTAQVQSGGGCASHSYAVCWDGAVLDSYPGMVMLALSHNAHGDPCEALLMRALHIDLTPVIEAAALPLQLSVVGATQQLAGTINTVRLGD